MDVTSLEKLLRRDRAIMLCALFAMAGLAWLWVIAGAGMGSTALEMTRTGLFPHLVEDVRPMHMAPAMASGQFGTFVAMVAMWWIMMVAMMLPSATPMMLLHARTVRYGQAKGRMPEGPTMTPWFLAGYLLSWFGFSVAAVILQMLLTHADLISGMMLWSKSRWISAGFLALAALYQLSPMKQVCLEHCRSPAQYLSLHWRDGRLGAVHMGLQHGAYCVGCCWGLMLLLFVGGVMNLIWIAALSIVVLIEKSRLIGGHSSRVIASTLLLWSLATLLV